ncbi:MAG: sigma-54-dependent Fis family transcriptional regulator [Deltaproteobacteria bacterium]|nr:sigma-54-dependent Fis family transcriptional regulator [Deltaproteobacteria bacterium]MBW1928511.1 sigma-54-dependent Fis family transcriptional regulator [Deltaproteobacteria bacterium]MBW2024261.1 sigma-54-dependent Fis family transcriptional regulator [Deltaproteobacteria bacterium]MBW2124617.1 sigma-54-dependent Fis family transcriptional regulator [Deltaproteobacteria bacterium]RLB19833.1 MAG: sigma-54-dependent Fis family transcriptional regulator [Deltaproteobacteria bacterium]
MGKEKVLVVDDESKIRDHFSAFLEKEGFDVDTAENGQVALEKIGEGFYDVVLIDLNMPKVDGMTVLKYLVDNEPESIGIILTGYASIRNAVEAMKAGAFDYLAKPIKMEEVLMVIKRAIEFRNLRRENIALKKQLKKKYKFDNFIGDSPQMHKVFRTIEKVADTDSTILILGESGTGKELVARAIHYHSNRRDKPLIPVNCGAIPEELLESELFGHEKGAFTNAIRTRIGRFEMANGGSIFLDEVAEMSPHLQVKLLRVLQEQTFERLGGTRTIKCDVRIIAATNKNLEKAVEEGKFREDLYYRLKVIPIQLPPLRDRKSDIPLLVNHFLEQMNRTKKKRIKGMEKDVLRALEEYDWPGNVRELENVIERMVILAEGEYITMEDLPEKIASHRDSERISIASIPEGGFSLSHAVNEYERQLIISALEKTGWVKNRAAKLLRMNRTTLVEKIKKQGIERPRLAS